MSLLEQLAKRAQENKQSQTKQEEKMVIGKPMLKERKDTPNIQEPEVDVTEEVDVVEEVDETVNEEVVEETNVVNETAVEEETKGEEVVNEVSEVTTPQQDTEKQPEQESNQNAQKSTQTEEKSKVVQMYPKVKKVQQKANKGHSQPNSNVLPAPITVTCEVYVYKKGDSFTRAEVHYKEKVYPVSRDVFIHNLSKLDPSVQVYTGVATLVGDVVSMLEIASPSTLNLIFNDSTLDKFGVITPSQLIQQIDGLVENEEDWEEVKNEFGVVGVITNPQGIITAFVVDMTKVD